MWPSSDEDALAILLVELLSHLLFPGPGTLWECSLLLCRGGTLFAGAAGDTSSSLSLPDQTDEGKERFLNVDHFFSARLEEKHFVHLRKLVAFRGRYFAQSFFLEV